MSFRKVLTLRFLLIVLSEHSSTQIESSISYMSSDEGVESFAITFNTRQQNALVVTACTADNEGVFQLMVVNSECHWSQVQ